MLFNIMERINIIVNRISLLKFHGRYWDTEMAASSKFPKKRILILQYAYKMLNGQAVNL